MYYKWLSLWLKSYMINIEDLCCRECKKWIKEMFGGENKIGQQLLNYKFRLTCGQIWSPQLYLNTCHSFNDKCVNSCLISTEHNKSSERGVIGLGEKY